MSRAIFRPRWHRLAGSLRPPSVTTHCFWNVLCCAPGTLKYRCLPTRTAPCCISVSVRQFAKRRHQKVIEEAPSPLLDAATRARIGRRHVTPRGAWIIAARGTVEFIVSADRPDEFFFMEMNTRLQVAPGDRMVTGWDLVEWQVRIAAGRGWTGRRTTSNCAAIPSRRGSMRKIRPPASLPTGGPVLGLLEPRGRGVRVDSGLCQGMTVGSDYDPMLAKVIAYGDDRAAALRTLDQALSETAVLGVGNEMWNSAFPLADDDVVAGRLDTGLLDRRSGDFAAGGRPTKHSLPRQRIPG